MGIRLFEHNQTAFDAAVDMLSVTGKAAVVHPTGTGKSYIGFKLCEQFPHKRVCWLSPSEYIFQTQLENIKRDSDGWQPENVSFFTYAKLMLMNDEEIAVIQPDYIILDEFHRCGAEQWGTGVRKMLARFPAVPVLGFSATAIRYLDNRRNMADELFDGNIASEMTLGEAIVRGILNPPKYVLSVFSYQGDFARLEYRVRNAKSKAVRDKAEQELQALRRALENADGLDAVFEKHMTDKMGKYIVFCSNKDHMYEMRNKTAEWFSEIDEAPHVYTAYSEDPSSDKAFAAFKSDESPHLKLLFCIDMLNEGIHVDDISGVILFRPTVSPIIYKQQIGRALAAGKRGTPVILDIVNNIENLCSIDSVQEEMQVAVSYYRSLGESAYIVNERFDVIDEVRDAKELFEILNETLSASWDVMYDCAKLYFEMYGHLEVPYQYKTPEGYSLGTWLLTQRRVYAGAVKGKLDQAQIKQLEQIGMVWDSKWEISWKYYYAAAKAYYEKHGDLNVPAAYVTDQGVKLGSWINNQRTNYKNRIRITSEQIEMLDSIGMIWDGLDYLWNRNYSAAVEYYRTYGDLDVPKDYVAPNGVRLYGWLNRIRSLYRDQQNQGALSADKVNALNEIGMDWRTWPEKKWDSAYARALRYHTENGNLDIPLRYKTKDGFCLGIWLQHQRARYDDGGLSAEQISKLDSLGMTWEKTSKAFSWDQFFRLAERYYLENGDLVVPSQLQVDGIWLGRWISAQRVGYKKHTLSADRIKKLESIGMFWGSRAEREWRDQFNEAKRYYQEYGDLNVPKDYITPSGKKTKYWLERQTQKRKNGLLSEQQLKLLKSIGWNG